MKCITLVELLFKNKNVCIYQNYYKNNIFQGQHFETLCYILQLSFMYIIYTYTYQSYNRVSYSLLPGSTLHNMLSLLRFKQIQMCIYGNYKLPHPFSDASTLKGTPYTVNIFVCYSNIYCSNY